MHAAAVRHAVDVAVSTARVLGLAVDDSIILQDSNRLTLRLMPCDVVARVADPPHEGGTTLELELVKRLAETGRPVATLDPRVAPLVYRRDGLLITFWTHYETRARAVAPGTYAEALEHLHTGLQELDVDAPSFRDRVAEARQLVGSPDLSPALAEADRAFLGSAFRHLTRAIDDRGAPEQLLHGEPHPGNVLDTQHGPLFIDLETGCRGPVEFDLAHVPAEVSARYPNVDGDLLGACRGLVLAMVTAWRWDRSDQFPDGQRARRLLLDALRGGPPYPTLDAAMGAG